MKNFLKTNLFYIDDFNYLKIGIASSKDIYLNSFGEIKKSLTYNYKTLRPENDGLFCEKIFGPIKNYECKCNKKIKYLQLINTRCKKCGIEIIDSSVRRKRMGHIKLNVPLMNILFLKSKPCYLSLLTNIKLNDLNKIVYYKSLLLIDISKKKINKYDYKYLPVELYLKNINFYNNNKRYKAYIGAEAILKLLEKLDLDYEINLLYTQLKEFKKINKNYYKEKIFKLQILETFKNTDNRLDSFIFKYLPVIPPDLRPLLLTGKENFVSSDLNEFYKKIIDLNNKLNQINIDNINKPVTMFIKEKYLLQESVDNLIQNEKNTKPLLSSFKKPLKSLSNSLKGKRGRFRLNLLGKRVDYSGRTVIISGPDLNINQCGLSKYIILELFKPFLLKKLITMNLVKNYKEAENIINNKDLIIWEILREIIKNNTVLLNRAPTLHRLGFQAFDIVFLDEKVIKLHPLVCAAFNADFDGDQMAVHLPLSLEAQIESRSLLMSTNNVLYPASGKLTVSPTQEMILGIYYATRNPINNSREILFKDIHDIYNAYYNQEISINEKVIFRFKELDEKGEYYFKIYHSTVGRAVLGKFLPDNISFSLINKEFTKSSFAEILEIIYSKTNNNILNDFVDKIMKLGFNLATKSGYSICIDDLIIPKKKNELILEARNNLYKINNDYKLNVIDYNKKYISSINIWNDINNKLTNLLVKEIKIDNLEKMNNNIDNKSNINNNPIYILLKSKARSSISQIRQLCGMRGLMLKTDNELIEEPVYSNFREGLNPSQYFLSSHGARKGLADTSLRTAIAGYLTRRLVDSVQNLIITIYDCKTINGILVSSLVKNDKIILNLKSRILGRFLLKDIYDKKNNKICNKDSIIDEKMISILQKFKISKVWIRTPIFCIANKGICVKCYGYDLSKNKKLINIGTAIGIIAAQSIGEPGTQLTMRTFHTGGIANIFNESSSEIRSKYSGYIKFTKSLKYVKNIKNIKVVVSYDAKIINLDSNNNVIENYELPYGSLLFVKEKFVKKDTLLFSYDLLKKPIISEYSGIIKYKYIYNERTVLKKYDKNFKRNVFVVMNSNERKLLKTSPISYNKKSRKNKRVVYPQIMLKDNNGFYVKNKYTKKNIIINIPSNFRILVKNNQKINKGDILAYIFKNKSENKDITGSLPKISDIFEIVNINKNNKAILSDIEGVVNYIKCSNNYHYINIKKDKNNSKLYKININQHITVYNGQYINIGDKITEGLIDYNNFLNTWGIDSCIKYIINNVQDIYTSQGVFINDKHIEIIVKQMLQRVYLLSQDNKKIQILTPDIKEYYLKKGIIINYNSIKYKNLCFQLYKINNFLIIFRNHLYIINKELILNKEEPLNFINELRGISKVASESNSFISAASFKESTKILTDAAFYNKIDYLEGLKENVITGRLIPAGSGYISYDIYNKIKENFNNLN